MSKQNKESTDKPPVESKSDPVKMMRHKPSGRIYPFNMTSYKNSKEFEEVMAEYVPGGVKVLSVADKGE